MNQSIYYVYMHRRATDGVPFYIGKGKDRRAFEFSKTQRSAYWSRVYKKYGVTVEFIARDLTEDEALDLEIVEIAKYKRYVDGGTLVNLTNGGDGTAGRYMSLKTRGLISNANRGFQHSEETKQKMSESKKGIPLGPFTDSHRENIRKSALTRPPISLATRHKISQANAGRKRSPEAVRAGADKLLGIPLKEEHKLSISNTLKGRKPPNTGKPHSKQAKEKMSMSHKGHVASEETRKKMSASRSGVKRGPYRKKIPRHIVYLVGGPSGIGKSWVCSQLTNCTYLATDDMPEMAYAASILTSPQDVPVVLEIAVGFSTFIKYNSCLFDIRPIVILEDEETLKRRLVSRSGEFTDKAGKRLVAMRKRAKKYAEFSGTSQEVLDYLRKQMSIKSECNDVHDNCAQKSV